MQSFARKVGYAGGRLDLVAVTQACKRGRSQRHVHPLGAFTSPPPAPNSPRFPFKQHAPARPTFLQPRVPSLQDEDGFSSGSRIRMPRQPAALKYFLPSRFPFPFSPQHHPILPQHLHLSIPTQTSTSLSIYNTTHHALHRVTARLCGLSRRYVSEPSKPPRLLLILAGSALAKTPHCDDCTKDVEL